MSPLAKVLSIFLGLVCISLIAVVSIDNWRLGLRSLMVSEVPKVLSRIEKDFFEDGRIIVFAKIKSHKGLFIDIYEKVYEGFPKTISRIRLPDDYDGFFHYRGQATNLALEDIDGDGRPEILAPSFDANHVAHLNVYTYNPATEQFEPLPPSAVDN